MVEWQSRNQLSDFTWRITIAPLKAYMGESENSVYPHKSLFKREHDDNPKIFFHRYTIFRQFHTVDGRNSAPVDKWFYLIIYKVSTIQAGAGFLLSTVYMYEYINMYSFCENCSTSSWSRQTGPRQTGRQGTLGDSTAGVAILSSKEQLAQVLPRHLNCIWAKKWWNITSNRHSLLPSGKLT